MGRRLPPINALRAFEATVRTGGVSSAADDLGVTHGAVSKQIQILNDWFGQSLFNRSGGRIVPTKQSIDFAGDIGAALDRLLDASERFTVQSTSDALHISAPATFAMRWLIPRLPSFHACHPNIDVQVTTTSAMDMGRSYGAPSDLILYRTAIDDDEHDTHRFLTEYSTILASPALLKRLPLREIEDIPKHTPLISDTRKGEWEEWLAVAGASEVARARSHRFNHYFVTLQAALDGMGIMIGPMPVLADDVEKGRLRIPFPEIKAVPRCYLARNVSGERKSFSKEAFLTWLVAEGERCMNCSSPLNVIRQLA